MYCDQSIHSIAEALKTNTTLTELYMVCVYSKASTVQRKAHWQKVEHQLHRHKPSHKKNKPANAGRSTTAKHNDDKSRMLQSLFHVMLEENNWTTTTTSNTTTYFSLP